MQTCSKSKSCWWNLTPLSTTPPSPPGSTCWAVHLLSSSLVQGAVKRGDLLPVITVVHWWLRTSPTLQVYSQLKTWFPIIKSLWMNCSTLYWVEWSKWSTEPSFKTNLCSSVFAVTTLLLAECSSKTFLHCENGRSNLRYCGSSFIFSSVKLFSRMSSVLWGIWAS